MTKSHKQIRLMTLTLSGLTVLGLSASPLSPEEAIQRLRADRNNAPAAKALVSSTPRYLRSVKSDYGSEVLHLYSLANRPGYLILSADDRITPLLGYSESGDLNKPEELPDGLIWWMNQIADEIGLVTASEEGDDSGDTQIVPSVGPAISPLVSARWGQTEPYNRLTPVISEKQSPTGCVATALTQIMYYHAWPPAPKGSVSYTDTSKDKLSYSMTFDGLQFEWEKMLDLYDEESPEDAIDAVALLMKAVGYGVHMTYGASSSGATDANANAAMTSYFGYSPDSKMLRRESFNRSEWEKILYQMLSAGLPIYYTGRDAVWLGSGGHAFVCDGYDGQGYFHFNWGWNDKYNGYFLTSCMTPAGVGTGGYANGYNYTQSIMVNMHPDNDKEYAFIDYVLGNKFQLNFDSNSVSATLLHANGKDFEAGFKINPVDEPEGAAYYSLGVTSSNFSSAIPEEMIKSLNPEKQYEFRMVWREDANQPEWQRIAGDADGLLLYNQAPLGGYLSYNNDKWSFSEALTDLDPMVLTISDITFNDEDYYISGYQNNLSFVTTNPTNDYEKHAARCYAVDESGKQTLFFNFTLEVNPDEARKGSYSLKNTVILPVGTYTLRFIDVVTNQEIPVIGDFTLTVYDENSILTHDDGTFKYTVVPNHDATLLQTSTGAKVGGDIYVPAEITIGEETYKVGKMQTSWSSMLDKKNVTSLKIDLPITDVPGSALSSMDNVTEIYLPETVKTIGKYGCAFNKLMTRLTIPEKIDHIDESAFFACYKLQELRVPAVDTIPESCFYGVYEVPELIVPEGVRVIEKQAFYNPKICTYIELPSTLESLGSQAFSLLSFSAESYLKEVKISAVTPPEIQNNTFSSSMYKSATLNVPTGSKELYAANPYWGKFSNINEFDVITGADLLPEERVTASEQWFTIDGIKLGARPEASGIYLRLCPGKAPEKIIIR